MDLAASEWKKRFEEADSKRRELADILDAIRSGQVDTIRADDKNHAGLLRLLDVELVAENERLVAELEQRNEELQAQQLVLQEQKEALEDLAFFDKLTALPNRHVFEDRLKQLISYSKRENQTFLVAVLDMNAFKEINDNLGHQAGDIVLETIAVRLASVVRDCDTVARFGGDEFVMLMPNAKPMHGAEVLSKRILDAVAAPISVMGEEIRVGISIGLSQYPTHGDESEALIKRADEAMYQAKTGNTGWKMADENSA